MPGALLLLRLVYTPWQCPDPASGFHGLGTLPAACRYLVLPVSGLCHCRLVMRCSYLRAGGMRLAANQTRSLSTIGGTALLMQGHCPVHTSCGAHCRQVIAGPQPCCCACARIVSLSQLAGAVSLPCKFSSLGMLSAVQTWCWLGNLQTGHQQCAAASTAVLRAQGSAW